MSAPIRAHAAQLIHDDCFKALKNIADESIDLILTDPPYGIGYKDCYAKKSLGKIQSDNPNDIDWVTFFSECYRVLKSKKMIYFCCRSDMLLRLGPAIQQSSFRFAHDFAWLKGDMGYGNLNVMGTSHELVLGLSKGSAEKSRVIKVDGEDKKRTIAAYVGKLGKRENYGHPTQKPVGLMAYIIMNRTDYGDVVLDPFCGSGSTLVAAQILNRKSIGIDLDERYINLTNKRLADEPHIKMYQDMIDKGLISKPPGVTFTL